MSRSSGIILHPTSLPGEHGIGDLGNVAYRFIDFLVESGQKLWQMLPLGPTGLGDSPYTSFSAFAGNPLLISPEKLIEKGYLTREDVSDKPDFSTHQVDYETVIAWKNILFERAYSHFTGQASQRDRTDFKQFCVSQQAWLDDFAFFMALLEAHKGQPWNTWPSGIANRQPQVLVEWRERLSSRIALCQFVQYIFHCQWTALKQYAVRQKIELIGDLPIFVAHNSADVWAHPALFWMDDDGEPTVVAGVPPDYFSESGQRWGNPLYRWDEMARLDYDWWIERIRMSFSMVDRIRLDHFRGFESYWEIPASEATAIKGRWVPGPRDAFFHTVSQTFGSISIIAEDLGIITPEVEILRDMFAFPGMKVLQFAFGTDATDLNLPHNYPKNCVVYTGTHDNDTSIGWYHTSSTPEERAAALRYLGNDGSEFNWSIIRLAFSSIADTAIIPLQDALGLGSDARMNRPGEPTGNWTWRFSEDMLSDHIAHRLSNISHIFGRHPSLAME